MQSCHGYGADACADPENGSEQEVDMKQLVAALVGLVIGAAGSWLYMDGRLQPALQRITQSESSRDLAAKAAKVLEEQIANAKQAGEKLQGTLKTLEHEVSEAKDKLTRALSEKQAAEKSASDLKTQLGQAVSDKEAAERALGEAKKPQ